MRRCAAGTRWNIPISSRRTRWRFPMSLPQPSCSVPAALPCSIKRHSLHVLILDLLCVAVTHPAQAAQAATQSNVQTKFSRTSARSLKTRHGVQIIVQTNDHGTRQNALDASCLKLCGGEFTARQPRPIGRVWLPWHTVNALDAREKWVGTLCHSPVAAFSMDAGFAARGIRYDAV